MTTPEVTGFYAACLTWLLIGLSVHTIRQRRLKWVALGDGGERALVRAIRAHANFAEYVPMALVLMLIVEMLGLASAWLHLLGISLLFGRLVHAYGITRERENLRFRIIGMSLTFGVLVLGSVLVLMRSVSMLLGQ